VVLVPAAADVEFFRRVCAGHYVLTVAEPSGRLLDAMVAGRAAYLAERRAPTDPAASPTVVVPTYESTTLSAWQQYSADELRRLDIRVAPAASQCVVQLQPAAVAAPGVGAGGDDNQCRAFRLEF